MSRRLRQFYAALTARVTAEEHVKLDHLLSQPELMLFRRMPVFDQRHCLDVYTTLVGNGYYDPALLRAALLHDCGKVDDQGRTIPLIYYGIFVVMKRLTPWLYTWLAGWSWGPFRPFGVHAAHDLRSASMVAAAGSDPALVEILRDYATRRMTGPVQALAWADEQN